VTREPFGLTIAPFSAHTLELRPRRGTGRRSGRHDVTVDNRGNARLDVRLEALDDGVARCTFAPPLLDLRPGERHRLRGAGERRRDLPPARLDPVVGDPGARRRDRPDRLPDRLGGLTQTPAGTSGG